MKMEQAAGKAKVKFDILIAVPGLAFNGETFDKRSIGGSESAGYYMGRALAARGHRVTVFCGTEAPQRAKDVDYLPIGMFRQYVEYTPHDVCIVQRSPELLGSHVRSRFTALWCHDLALGRSEPAIKGVAWNYDKLFVLSEFMREQYKKVYGVPDELLHLTRNGVDLATVGRAREALPTDALRNPLSMVYAARPERGLEVLLAEVMPRILKVEPNAKLFLATYENPVDHLAEFYTHCKALADNLNLSVQYLGHLTKEQLYTALLSAGVYVYPVPSKIALEFDEISCIAAMEAQACGLPVVTSARGALPETLAPEAGVLVAEKIHTSEYYDAFAEAVLRLMRDPDAHRRASAAGLERAAQLDWAGVAEDWERLFEREIRARSSDLATLANHFWRRSDIYAARECLSRLPVDDEKSRYVRERVGADWAFLDAPDGFRDQYERIGATHDARVIDWSPNEPRYRVLDQWLAKHKDDVTRALDYGCAHGGYAINLLQAHPDLRITGVDIDTHGIEMAYAFAEQRGVAERWRGVVGSYERLSDAALLEMQEEYDVAIAQEVLEHVPDPAAVLRALEARVKDGGYIYATVPFGPWEYTDYKRYPHRAHIWEFDQHDLHELLDAKGAAAEVTISSMPYGHEPNTDESLGWWVIEYRVTAETRGVLGAIDMERKLWLQRPRQTVSATIIAGPNSEDQLHWCLRALEHVADEYVVADCGLSAEALRILSTYDSRMRVIKGCDPKTEGFEAPRNIALAEATQDFVLWVDTDERLLQPERLHKYLRRNIFQGYSIRQHHFAVDTTFDADLPVRLFRNNGALRFYGMIHEHPESEINAGPGRMIVLNDVHIAHTGYLIESGREKRFARNYPLLQADITKYPTRKLQKHFIMRDNMLMCTYELKQNGGRISSTILERCRETIAIYREYFLGKGHFTNSDPLQYYSQAVGLMASTTGEGIDFAFQIAADKMDASGKINGTVKARFASVEDAEAEILHRVRDVAEPYNRAYY